MSIIPDNEISISMMESYGYKYDNKNKMLPLFRERALELFEKGATIYLLYSDNSESLAERKDELNFHFNYGGICGIEMPDWEKWLESRI